MSGCSLHQSVFKKDNSVPYTEEEFNIMVAAAYFKHTKKDCNDTCRYIVNSEFHLLNPNFLMCESYKRKFENIGFNFNKIVNLRGIEIPVERVGNVFFGDYKDPKKTTFAPAVYFPDQKFIIGQVEEKGGKYTIFTCMLLGDKIFWSDEGDFFDCFIFPKDINSKSSNKILQDD